MITNLGPFHQSSRLSRKQVPIICIPKRDRRFYYTPAGDPADVLLV